MKDLLEILGVILLVIMFAGDPSGIDLARAWMKNNVQQSGSVEAPKQLYESSQRP